MGCKIAAESIGWLPLGEGAHLQDGYYLWRPFLRDLDDDMVLEWHVVSDCVRILRVLHTARQWPPEATKAVRD